MTQPNGLDKNLLICADNLSALDDLVKKGIKADLIYLDPPFFSNRHYEVVWGDEAEVRSFKDRWSGGIIVYVDWMKERVVKMLDVLKDTGTFYLHCDWHAGHYLKVMLDEVFGYHNFRNEIVWCYRGAGYPKKDFGKRHDTIYRYSKTEDYIFNLDDVREEYAEATKERFKHYIGNVRKSGDFGLQKLNPLGKQPDDWWQIQPIAPSANERLGYPTQKPETLLEKIIKASSNKGDIVLDPFCGCGTTVAVAQRLGRRWVGIDISPTATKLIENRLVKFSGAKKDREFEVVGMPTTLSALRALEPFEFQNWVINEMKAKQSKKLTSDFGLDGYYDKTIFTDPAGIQVKQSEHIGRNVVDNFETALKRAKYAKGYIVAFSFGKGACEEAARAKHEGLEVKLVEVDDLLHGNFKV
ncbi:MAG: site-specific DNA-methyltransferase [Acidobacteriota bacterium]